MELSEEEYNKQVAVMLERIRCPICNAQPKVIEGIAQLHDDGTVTEGTVVTCQGLDAHTYMINQEEDDE